MCMDVGAACLGHEGGDVLYMGQGHQLDAGRRDGHRAVAQQAVQEEPHVVFGGIGAVDVQGLEHCVRQALQSHRATVLHSQDDARSVPSFVSSSTGHTAKMLTQGGGADQKAPNIEQEAKAANVQ